jgi:hypothetical protein
MKTLSAYSSAVVLSVNRGLWGLVSRNLRAVYVKYRDADIHLYCYFDGAVSEEDEEAMSEVGTSVAADFPDHIVHEHCVRLDAPQRIPVLEEHHLVFKRKEKDESVSEGKRVTDAK